MLVGYGSTDYLPDEDDLTPGKSLEDVTEW